MAMAALLLAVSACSGTASVKEAEKEVAAFHRNLDKGNYDAIWKDSSEQITKGETKEKLVVYVTLYANDLAHLWVRPLAMFNEEVVVGGERRPRFQWVGDR